MTTKLTLETVPYFIQGRIAANKRTLDDPRCDSMERARIHDANRDLNIILEALEGQP